ncbi:MAG: glycosyltransferase [Planctomycetota bacterium]
MKRVLVFDHAMKMTGHRLPYASLVSQAFDESKVVVCLPKQLESEQAIRRYFSANELHFFATEDRPLGVAFSRESFRCLRNVMAEVEPDHVAIPTADGIGVIAGMHEMLRGDSWRKHASVSACLMRIFPMPSSFSIKKSIVNRLRTYLLEQAQWTQLMTLDALRWLEMTPRRRSRLLVAPDPVPKRPDIDRSIAREKLGLPTNGRLLVSAGNQDARKGSDLLIEAFANAKLAADDRLLLIGRHDSSVKSQLSGHQPLMACDRLLSRDQYVSEEDFTLSIIASDVVVAPYRSTDRPSGVVSRAVAWGRPIVATNSGWMRWVCESLNAGSTFQGGDTDELGKALTHSLEELDAFKISEQASRFAEYNTEENFKRLWKAGLDGKEKPSRFPTPTFLGR